MKVKTIEKVLSKKINEWLDTITDADVRELARGGTIITGGSIASLLLNEKVNDFDLYFKSVTVVKALAEYYSKDFPNLKVIDGSNYQGMPTPRDQDGVELTDQWNSFIKNMDWDRIKIFCKGINYFSVTGEGSLMAEPDELELNTGMFESISQARELVKPGEYKPLFFTANAITLSDQIQLVLRFHGSPEKLHENYDYVHATNYYDHDTGKVTVSEEALESLLTRELRYIGSLYPVTSVIRSKKFIKRGWTITAGEYLKMLFQVSQLDLTDPDVLQEQILSVDIAYFSILIEALENRDTKVFPNITYGYICTLIDKIFN